MLEPVALSQQAPRRGGLPFEQQLGGLAADGPEHPAWPTDRAEALAAWPLARCGGQAV